MVTKLSDDVKAALEVVRVEMANISVRVNVVRAVENQTPTWRTTRPNKVKLTEPKPFSVAHDAKALKNYIFDLEQYFKATDTETEEEKITAATMHLVEDAKLWWRSKYVDIQELQSQFFPKNVEIMARRKLCDLKHTSSIREYVKQFSLLMLDIRQMSELDKIIQFTEGLKPWAKSKLYEHDIEDLSTAYAMAERLFDLNNEQPQETRPNQASSSRGNRNHTSNPSRMGGGDKLRIGGVETRQLQQGTGVLGKGPHN